MPRGVYPRKRRTWRKKQRNTAANRAQAAMKSAKKLDRIVARETRAAASSLLNIARARVEQNEFVTSNQRLVGALAQGLGFTR